MATDYEKKYKEALERAKKFEDKYGGDYAGYIFPELAESEDERIRKELINIVKGACDKYGIKYKGDEITEEKLLAYLEKQKEQKPAENGVDVIKTSALLAADRLASAEMTGRLKERSEILDNPTKYGLQKPAEWSEEYELMRTAVIQTLERFGGRGTTGMQIDWLRSLPERFNLQPKNEWSEEDEAIRIEVIKLLSNPSLYEACEHLREESVDWLKTLHTKVNVNSEKVSANSEKVNVNWSEEDENVYESIQTILLAEARFVEERKWFDSIKARIKSVCWDEKDEKMRDRLIDRL